MEKHPDIQLTIMQHHLPDDITDPVLYITSEMKPGMTNIPIMKEPVYVAIPKKHPLAKRTSAIRRYPTHPILMLSKSNAFRHTLDAALEAKVSN